MTKKNSARGIRYHRFPAKGFRTPQQEQKVMGAGECAKPGCGNAALKCMGCNKWWKLDTDERLTSYTSANPRCPFCSHRTIIHSFYCEQHRYLCSECELDHPAPGCPFRDLREAKPIREIHMDWLRQGIGFVDLEHEDLFSEEKVLTLAERDARNHRAKELLLFLFEDGKGQIKATKDRKSKKDKKKKHQQESRFGNIGRVMKLLEAIHKRQVESYDGWERGMSEDRSKHGNSPATRAGMAKPSAKEPGRPRKKSK